MKYAHTDTRSILVASNTMQISLRSFSVFIISLFFFHGKMNKIHNDCVSKYAYFYHLTHIHACLYFGCCFNSKREKDNNVAYVQKKMFSTSWQQQLSTPNNNNFDMLNFSHDKISNTQIQERFIEKWVLQNEKALIFQIDKKNRRLFFSFSKLIWADWQL